MFSTCFLRLLRSLPVWPQRVHLWAFNPASGALTIYSYSCLSPPVRSRHDEGNYCKNIESFSASGDTRMKYSCALLTYDCWASSLLGTQQSQEGSVCIGMKRFQGNEHSQCVSSNFHDHSQSFHILYICVRAGHTQAPSLYSRKAACPLKKEQA